jgi:hypothetical protein
MYTMGQPSNPVFKRVSVQINIISLIPSSSHWRTILRKLTTHPMATQDKPLKVNDTCCQADISLTKSELKFPCCLQKKAGIPTIIFGISV